MEKTEKTEAELIYLLRSGSKTAFNWLYNHYAPKLYSFCLHMSKSKESAEDIVEETFIWLWKHKETLPEQDSLKNILFLRTRHQLIDIYRKNLNSPHFESYLEYVNKQDHRSASELLDYNDFLHCLQTALEQLPLTQQKVIKMSKLEGLSIREISERLQLGEQTVRNQQYLGLKTLRKLIYPQVVAGWLLKMLMI